MYKGLKKELCSYLIAISLLGGSITVGKFLADYGNKRIDEQKDSIKKIEWVNTNVPKRGHLWMYAAPYADEANVRVRVVIDEIMKKNGLESKCLQEGQQLWVPKAD